MILIAIITATLAAGIGSVWLAAGLLSTGLGTRPDGVGTRHLLSLAAGALLAEHLRDFPDGVFIDLRMAIEVELLCSQGLDQEAASRAAALLASHPRSAVAQRLVDFSCPR